MVYLLVYRGLSIYLCRSYLLQTLLGTARSRTSLSLWRLESAITVAVRALVSLKACMKEDRESWRSFFVWLKERELTGVCFLIGDKNLEMLETISEVFSNTCYQHCRVRFNQKIFSVTPKKKIKAVIIYWKRSIPRRIKKPPERKPIRWFQNYRKWGLELQQRNYRMA